VALNFPSSPTIGQIYTDSISGFSYEWNGTVWISFSAASSSQIKPLDDISGSFDDVTQTFALTSNSVSITPPTAQSLIINLGGVIQDATDDYSVTSSNITFSTPPASGLSFSGVSLGPAIPINTIPDGTVTDGSLTVAGILSTSNLFVTGLSTFAGITTVTGSTLFTNQLSVSGISTFTGAIDANGDLDVDGHTELDDVNISGITTFVGAIDANGDLDVDGHTELDDVNISGTLNVVGLSTFAGITTVTGTTLFTKQLNVLGISTFTNGPVFIGAATSTGTATQRLQVTGGAYVSGNLGIGTTNPTHKLHVLGDARITGILTVGTGSITLDGSTNTISGITTINTTSINGGPLAGLRNAIINGNFDFWQRGAPGAGFTGSEYGADRWFHNRVGTAHTATRQAFTVGQTDVPGEPTYYCRTVVSSVAGAGNYAVLIQRIEDVRTFAGQQVTVSFWAKADATKNIAVELSQVFGSGGSPSTTVNSIGTTKISIGTTWQKVTVAATMPSISGKTLGTNGNSRLGFNIWLEAGSTYNARTDSLGQQSGTFEIAQVQVEPGPVDTPFERRPIGTELSLCQRYFEKSYDLSVAPGTAANYAGAAKQRTQSSSSFHHITSAVFQVKKRGIPTVTIYNPETGATGTVWDTSAGGNSRDATVDNTGESGTVIKINNVSIGAGAELSAHYTASAEL
jgi:hypothetical protein